MFAMVLLTFSTLVRLFRMRSQLVRKGEVDPKYYRVYQGESEPEASAALGRHFANLFEAPVLFYVCCLAAMIAGVTGTLFLVLAWLYVLTRFIHTFIHTGTNSLWPRIYAYFSSWVVLLGLWGVLIVRASGLV